MAWRGVLSVLVIAVGLGLILRESMPDEVDQLEPVVRVGVFDNRAIAVAYARSIEAKRQLESTLQRHAEAKKSGDAELVKRIERGLDRRQWLMHRQGFGVESVRDLLKQVEPGLADVKRESGLAMIAWEPMLVDFDHVQLVDVTDELVELFEPDEATRSIIDQLRKSDPVEVDFEFED